MIRSLPDLSDDAAMAARGRRSALISARNEAAAEVRDVSTAIQTADFERMPALAETLRAAADRLHALSDLWENELHAPAQTHDNYHATVERAERERCAAIAESWATEETATTCANVAAAIRGGA